MISEEEELATRFGIPVLRNLPPMQLPRQLLEKISYSFVRQQLVLPLELTSSSSLLVATADPLNVDAIDELQLRTGLSVETVYCARELLLEGIEETFRKAPGSAEELLAGMSDSKASRADEAKVYDLLDGGDEVPIIKLLNLILTEAIQQDTSDIHFEPLENDLRVRFRIDGRLVTRHAPPREHQAQLLTRLKVMARLDIAERRLPQDGRIRLRMGGREIDFRVSTVPVAHGERIVLRILDKGNIVLGLDKLGIEPQTLSSMRELIRIPEGIVLVTGPTGSGKTTTLYSALSEVCSDEMNIMTVEDPIEYKLHGVAQIAVHPKIGLTFSAGLRHILRQDPDIIMIGEIRDRETAEIAIQSALTGHLVFSTLHTNDAPSALTRLVDMGIEPYLLTSSVVGVLAQRLVRALCSSCRGQGCETCFDSGFKGRRGIYELMPVTEPIKKQLVRSADAVTLRQLAMGQGMQTLFQQGLQLVERGVTTLEEVHRVTRAVEGERGS